VENIVFKQYSKNFRISNWMLIYQLPTINFWLGKHLKIILPKKYVVEKWLYIYLFV